MLRTSHILLQLKENTFQIKEDISRLLRSYLRKHRIEACVSHTLIQGKAISVWLHKAPSSPATSHPLNFHSSGYKDWPL